MVVRGRSEKNKVERKKICQFFVKFMLRNCTGAFYYFFIFSGGLINSPALTVQWPQDVWSEINERTTGRSSGGGVVFGGEKADLKKPKERIEDGF